jgi:hypothetical protein
MTDRSPAGAPAASRRKRTRIAMLATGLLAVALGGCSQFNAPPTGAQQDVIGAVRISSVVCNTGFGSSDQPSPLTSPSPCDTGSGGPLNVGQYLVGYMIPDGSSFPTTLTSPDLPANTFSLSPSYAAALQAQQGAQAGMHWVGYVSDTVTKVSADELVHIDADFTLPAQAGGNPFAGPMDIAEVIGDREVDPTYLADRPVDCSESRPTGFPIGFPQTEYPTSCIQDSATTDVVTRDLALSAGAGGSVKPGGTITLPYSARFAGPAGPEASFALTAQTDLPGATATPANATLQPAGDSTTPETVDVTVPAGAKPGTYAVTLSAEVSGQRRAADATFTVATAPVVTPDAPVVPGPVAALPALTQSLGALKRPTVASLSANGMPVTVGCDQACTTTVDVLAYQNTRYKQASTRFKKGSTRAAWKLQPTVLVGRQYVNRSAAGKKSVRVKLLPAAKAALKHVNSYTLIVRTTSVDANGDQRTSAKVAKVRYANVCAHKQGCITKVR